MAIAHLKRLYNEQSDCCTTLLVRVLVLLLALLHPAWGQEVSKLSFDTFQRSPVLVGDSENEFVDPHLGSLRLSYEDINIPGNGSLDLKVIRTYDSARVARDGKAPSAPYTPQPLGWTIHYGRILERLEYRRCGSDGYVPNNNNFMPLLEMPDGVRRLVLLINQTGYSQRTTIDRWWVECTAKGYLVKSPDGTKYYMEYSSFIGPYRCTLPDA